MVSLVRAENEGGINRLPEKTIVVILGGALKRKRGSGQGAREGFE